jgi:hypothetical protein
LIQQIHSVLSSPNEDRIDRSISNLGAEACANVSSGKNWP